MSKQYSRSSMEIVPPVVPSGYKAGATVRRKRLAAIIGVTLWLVYVAGAYFLLGPTQPALWQRLLALGGTAVTVAAYLLLTRPRESTDELMIRARLAQRSDFGKHQVQAWLARQNRGLTLPVIGKVTYRVLGGVAVLVLSLAWWLSPLAPVRVRERMSDDLTMLLGEELAAASLVMPDGRVAVVCPPVLFAHHRQLARSIKDDTGSYNRGIKAMVEGRHGEARIALNAALTEGQSDRNRVNLARAQNEMYAGLFADAARLYETAVQESPEDPITLLQAAIAWLHLGAADKAAPFIDRATKVCQGKSPQPDRLMAYCLHAKAMLQVVGGNQFSEVETYCAQSRELAEKAADGVDALLAASLNNEAVLYMLIGKYPGALNRFEESRYNWAKCYGQNHPIAAVNHSQQALLQVFLAQYGAAQESLSRAETICRELLPEDHVFIAQTRICRALLQRAKGNYVDGAKTAANGATIIENNLGATHPANVPALGTLAALQTDLAMYRRAAAAGQRAVDLSRRIWGPQHPFYGAMLAGRARIDLARQAMAKTETACREAVAALRPLSTGSPAMADALEVWGQLEIARGKAGDARSNLEKALKIREDTLGKEHPDVAVTLAALAGLDNSPRTFAKGETAFVRAIAMSEKFLGNEHPQIAVLLRGQAILFAEQGKITEAAADFDKAIAIEEKSLPPNHPELAATLEAYAAALRNATPPDEKRAAELHSRAETIRQQHQQADKPE